MQLVTKRRIPAASLLHAVGANAYFADSFISALHDRSLTPAEISLRVSRATPAWAEALMSLRNRVVRLLGLKAVGGLSNVGSKPAAEYAIGDRMGIFSIYAQTPDELVMGIDDRHLDVRVSILKGPDSEPPLRLLRLPASPNVGSGLCPRSRNFGLCPCPREPQNSPFPIHFDH